MNGMAQMGRASHQARDQNPGSLGVNADHQEPGLECCDGGPLSLAKPSFDYERKTGPQEYIALRASKINQVKGRKL